MVILIQHEPEAFEPLSGELQDKTQLESLSLHLAQLLSGSRTMYSE
jgi:hypothetical protein